VGLVFDAHLDQDVGVELNCGLIANQTDVSHIEGIPVARQSEFVCLVAVYLSAGVPFLAKNPKL
jgi:hypothetical protein